MLKTAERTAGQAAGATFEHLGTPGFTVTRVNSRYSFSKLGMTCHFNSSVIFLFLKHLCLNKSKSFLFYYGFSNKIFNVSSFDKNNMSNKRCFKKGIETLET